MKTQEQSGNNEEQSGNNEEQQVQEESEEQEEPDVRSQRVTKPVIRCDFDDFADMSNVAAQHVTFRTSKIDEPTTIKEALSADHSKQWKMAANVLPIALYCLRLYIVVYIYITVVFNQDDEIYYVYI